MKGRLSLFIILAFYVGALYNMFSNTSYELFKLYPNHFPFIEGVIGTFIMIILYGVSAILALSLLLGVKPRKYKLFYRLVIIVTFIWFGRMTLDLFLLGNSFGGSVDYPEAAFMLLGTVFPFYLFFKMGGNSKKTR